MRRTSSCSRRSSIRSGRTALLASVLGALSPGLWGCTDVCDEAAEKAEECGILPTTLEDEEADIDCADAVECSAECVNQATCADLQDRDNPDTAFYQCVLACDQN